MLIIINRKEVTLCQEGMVQDLQAKGRVPAEDVAVAEKEDRAKEPVAVWDADRAAAWAVDKAKNSRADRADAVREKARARAGEIAKLQ